MLINKLKNKNEQRIGAVLPSKQEKKAFPVSQKKHFPASTREWNNNIYSYNPYTIKNIPYAEVIAMKIIKAYFSLYNRRLERFVRNKTMLKRLRKLSSNKIYFSRGEFKHYNDKVIVNLYIYNRQKYNYLYLIKKWYLKFFSKKFNVKLIKRLNIINDKALTLFNKSNEQKLSIIETLNKGELSINRYNIISLYINRFYRILLNKSIRKIKLYYGYKRLLYINKSLTNYSLLRILKKHIEKIYDKNVEFNLINLKRFFFNSDIFSQTIGLKITRNRRKLLKYLNTLKKKIHIKKRSVYINRYNFNNKSSIKQFNNYSKLLLQGIIFKNIKYKNITGFRLQAKGRLTKRYTASRSLYKVKYRGNLSDYNSSLGGLSTVLLRGKLKSNLQSTKLKSKTRIGSFGIKGWISGN